MPIRLSANSYRHGLTLNHISSENYTHRRKEICFYLWTLQLIQHGYKYSFLKNKSVLALPIIRAPSLFNLTPIDFHWTSLKKALYLSSPHSSKQTEFMTVSFKEERKHISETACYSFALGKLRWKPALTLIPTYFLVYFSMMPKLGFRERDF